MGCGCYSSCTVLLKRVGALIVMMMMMTMIMSGGRMPVKAWRGRGMNDFNSLITITMGDGELGKIIIRVKVSG